MQVMEAEVGRNEIVSGGIHASIQLHTRLMHALTGTSHACTCRDVSLLEIRGGRLGGGE